MSGRDEGVQPAVPRCEPAFEVEAAIGELVVIGATKHGTRQMIPITSGRVSGPRLSGEVLAGGADWQLLRPDGVLEIDARYVVRAADGANIHVRNRGFFCQKKGELYVRTVPQFEAPADGPHAWLNLSIFIGTIALERPGHVRIRVFEVV